MAAQESKHMSIDKDTIIVAIPYLAKGAQGDELEWAIAGWEQHFKEKNFTIVIVGDNHPCISRYDNALYLSAPRVAPVEGEYLPALDIINKMTLLCKTFPLARGIVWSADDIYAVNNFDLSDIKFLKMLEPDLQGFALSDPNPWRAMMARTREALSAEGYPTRNFALHLPCLYDCDKLTQMIDKYDLRRRSLSVQSLYFNIYYGDRVPFRLNSATDNLKLGIYTKHPTLDDIRAAFRSKIWLNNSVVGFVPEFYHELEKHYSLK